MSGRRSNAVVKVKAAEAVEMSDDIDVESECDVHDGLETLRPVDHTSTKRDTEGVGISENRQSAENKIVISVRSGGRRRRRKQHTVKSGNTEPVMNENILEMEKPDDDDQEESCFKIDKVYSVAGEDDDMENDDNEAQAGKTFTNDDIQEEGNTLQTAEKVPNDHEDTDKKTDVKGESKVALDESKTKEERQIQPRVPRATLAKVPTLTAAGGVGSLRMLGGGVRGTNMPLIVSMGAGNPAIPLLPAGLPPGRYVILPGTPGSSTTTTKTSAVTTMSTSRLATSVVTSGTHGLVAAQKTIPATPLAPPSTLPAAGGERIYTRERGRRKSYTAGEKLAMIRAVEGGQRKSAVADRFGVAPSTLASILAQKHKIKSEQDNLTRRRVRRYQLRDEAVSRSKVLGVHSGVSSMRLSTASDHPFTHFLAPLSAPPTVLDTQPEDIVAVPDLIERLSGGSSGPDTCKQESAADTEDEARGDDISFLEPESVLESALLQDPSLSKGKGFQQAANTSHGDGDDAMSQDGQAGTSPTAGTSGLVGPYLLKKDAHCSTVLDQLMRDETFTDVTLTAEGQSLRAHRRPQQSGFTPGKSTKDRILALRVLVERRREFRQGMLAAYVDLIKKAFDSVHLIFAELLEVLVMALEALHEEAKPLGLEVSWLKTKVQIVLCLASPYFRQVLSRELTVQSVVVLRDIKFSELRNIIHFIYTGEATVDASELESFMRTAELLEIASLCEGQKSTSSRGPLSQNCYSSGFTIGDFERLVGTKRTKKEASPTPSKVRRLSGEGHSSRSSSTEPTATVNPLSLIKEESECENLFNDKPVKGINENVEALIEGSQESERTRRDSGDSVGGFAAIAGVQKSSNTDERTEDFSSIAASSPVPSVDDSIGQSPTTNLSDKTAVPGRCPYCPHLAQKFEGVAMMRHLLVSHPCKPAFPCDGCWRVFVKRTYFKSHQQKCTQPPC
ncbi:Broad-complex core protein isoform 6 [Chionoecetes opilio]|uniref:Broad-complex core protein isoform 6 n=1 Tax=Chionoecetes opilio TaxID=41210 RepID=A0A8J5CQ19_CHIOP|nr:Broad-complex core protein isoform 6 [Chionoecetes opilio]